MPNGKNTAKGANEDAIADAFAARHVDNLRYCHERGAWFKWSGEYWKRDRCRLAFEYARQAARGANIEGKAALAKAATAAGVEAFAKADPRLATTSDVWDQSPWLLATPGGTIDLRTGSLRPAARNDYITRIAGATPAPQGTPTPIWDGFLNDATGGDRELINYLQRLVGYCLTGDVREQVIIFIYGPGGNGKGIFLNTLTKILCNYAITAPMETFCAGNYDRHPTELAMLCGARLVTAQETEEGRAWNEVRIKALTGGDPITARFMRKDFFTFAPTFKVLIAGNHKPNLRSVDDAHRRRFNIIPFVHKPPSPDPYLMDKLKDEWPGILRWAIEGCLAWQRDGLSAPKIIRDATRAYFDEQDVFTQWIEERCEVGRAKTDTHEALYTSYRTWMALQGDMPGTSKTFSQAMAKAGFELVKNTPGHHGKRGFRGIRVKPLDTSQQWRNQRDE
jgi:putative DNA primase/helicase